MIFSVLKRGPPSTHTAPRAPVGVRVCVPGCACGIARVCVRSPLSAQWVRSLTPILAPLV